MMSHPAVIITGAARRVGASLARHFAHGGYDVALHYNASETQALALQREIQAMGVACALFRQDLADITAIPALMGKIRAAMPHCVALINNAAVFERATFMETDEALFDRQFITNFKAPFFLTQSFARHFGPQLMNGGCVVNILDTDIAGTNGSHFAYLLSKKALADFTVMAARALGPDIRVNGICPGCLIPADANDAIYVDKLKDVIPLKSHPAPEEAAEAAGWLVGQSHITGQLLHIDGGKHVL